MNEPLPPTLPEPVKTEFSETLDALMSKDPAAFTSDDCQRVVKELRAQRNAFMITEKLPKGKNKIKAPTNLSLDELDLP